MLKVNGEYLDFNGDIEIEKKIKLFEDISTTDGDLSFAFDLQLTSNNIRILQIPVPDSISKIVYQENECIVQNDSGITINNGALRIESVSGYVASCSFLGGNSNWFAALDGDMTELRLSQYDRDLNESEIVASWSDTEGIIFPFIDTGLLVTRGSSVSKLDDYVGCFYLHTLFKEVFSQSGIKIQGDLLNDSLYNQTLVAANTRNIVDKNNNSVYVSTDTPQVGASLTTTNLTLEDNSIPYFIGEGISTTDNLNFYVSTKMIIEWEMSIKSGIGTSRQLLPFPKINGASAFLRHTNLIKSSGLKGNSTTGYTYTLTYVMTVEAGEYLTLSALNIYLPTVTTQSAYMKVTPRLIYKAFGSSCVPLWSKQKFVGNILKMFNVITSYNQFTKTLTLDLFDKIKTKPSIDLSEFITVDTIDYSEFISNYGKVNNFEYTEGTDEDLAEYNISSFIKYGAGTIECNNYYVVDSADVIKLDFTSPISYLNSVFNCSIERVNFLQVDEDDDLEITSITDSSGIARFNITNADTFLYVDDLVRIKTTDYNGDFIVSVVTSTYVEFVDVEYNGTSDGIANRLEYKVTGDDNVYLFINIPLRETPDISDLPSLYLNQTAYTNWSIAFFNLLQLGRPIEDEYKQGLSFSPPESILTFQKTLIDKYWQQFARILNDPVKPFCSGYLPWKVYNSIDFLQPISIRTKETSNLYYVNRMTGYKDSSQTCEVELIKLP